MHPLVSHIALAGVVFAAGAGPLLAQAAPAPARPDAEVLARAVREVERLDALRSALARGFEVQGVPADRATFQQVCRPVGQEAQRIAKENGWFVAQLAEKYRNPEHALDAEARGIHELLRARPDVAGIWMRTEWEGRPGTRYLRRIVVEPACLSCHGSKEARPAFVVEGYPEDRAYGFRVGDLRGLYSVFVPDGP